MQSSNDNYNDGTNSQISHTIDTISQILEEIIQESESQDIPSDQPQEIKECINKFTIKKVPSITINKYLRRIVKYANPEQSTLIMVLIYIDKICDNSNVQLTANNIHRLILASIVLSIKNNEDDYYSNEYYAKVGGISLDELNSLEYAMIILLDFNVYIDEEIYYNYESSLQGWEQ